MATVPIRGPMLALHQPALPLLTPAFTGCVRRQPVRQSAEQIAGSPPYIQCLSTTVLPQQGTRGGSLCTRIAADGAPSTLLVGVCILPGLDLQTALPVKPWAPHSGVDGETPLQVWPVRVIPATECRPNLESALVAAVDRETLQIVTHRGDRLSKMLTSVTHVLPRDVDQGMERSSAHGLLVDLPGLDTGEVAWERLVLEAYQAALGFATGEEQHYLEDVDEKWVAVRISPTQWRT